MAVRGNTSWYRALFYSLMASFAVGCPSGCAQSNNYVGGHALKPMPLVGTTTTTGTSSVAGSCFMPIDDLVQYHHIKTSEGHNYFTDGQICLLGTIPPEYSAAIASTKRVPLFDAADILLFSQYGVPDGYAQKLGAVHEQSGSARYNSFAISRFHQLGLTAEEVINPVDTNKPNLIVAYPNSPHDNAFENDDALRLFRGFKDHYDIFPLIWVTEDDIYRAMDTVPNASFFGNGHGSKTTLGSGDYRLTLNSNRSNEKTFIDTGDTELAPHLAKLDPEGFIFLFSCGVGAGGSADPKNLINFIAEQAGGRKVIGAETELKAYQVHVTSYQPLQITVDVAYTAKKKN